jgi:hypothetical protein
MQSWTRMPTPQVDVLDREPRRDHVVDAEVRHLANAHVHAVLHLVDTDVDPVRIAVIPRGR